MSKVILKKKLPIGKITVHNAKPKRDGLIGVHQIHSAEIVEYTGNDISKVKVDGILVLNKNIKKKLFAIKTADCMPVIFIGTKGICIIHAGWVGLRDKILVHMDIKKINPYYCYIGPSIGVDSFEVQNDFKNNFPDSPYFVQNKDFLSFNLRKEATQQIKTSFPSIDIEYSHECTYKNFEYNSFRRDKTTERNWNIFSI